MRNAAGSSGRKKEKAMDSIRTQTGYLRVDAEKTRAYYAAVRPEELCACPGCQNYRSRVKRAYPRMAGYLKGLGIDIEKPFHVSYIEMDDPSRMLYLNCCYVAFGACSPDFRQQIGQMLFAKAGACPSSGVDEPHMALEIPQLELPWEE